MLWVLIPLTVYTLPWIHNYNVDKEIDPIKNESFYPLLTIVFCTITLLMYYIYVASKYPSYNSIHKKLILTLSISITSKFLILCDIPNVIYVYNDLPVYLFRWSEWLSCMILLMWVVSDTIVDDIKTRKLYMINIYMQFLCILFGYMALFTHFWINAIISTIIHFYILYILYYSSNMFIWVFEGVSTLITVYYFLYFRHMMDITSYHQSIWVCELLLKGIFVILTTTTFMLQREYIMEEYIHREKVFYIIHDLRIHLNSLRLGLSELTESNDVTRLMKVSLNSMVELINQVLFFNKIFKDNLQLHKDFFSVKTLLTQIIDEFSFQFVQGHFAYKLNIPEDHFIYADRKGIKTLFLNLLSNALKYTKNEIIVDVTFKKEEDDLIRMDFAVSDNGPGVPEYFLPNLFKPFSQTNSKENSSGLGLYLSKKIIEAHKGYISYRYNNGAVFYGSLTTIYKEKYLEILPISNETIKIREFTDNNIKKILITDDSTLNRTLLSRVLKSLKNFEILEASNGTEAIQAFIDNQDIDLIFMDFHMPNMTGKEVIDKLHEMGYKRNIILLSGLMKEELFKTFDINYIMIKPIYKQTIVKLLETEKIL